MISFGEKKNQGLKMHLAIIVQVAIGHTAAKLEFLNQDDFFFCKKKKKNMEGKKMIKVCKKKYNF